MNQDESLSGEFNMKEGVDLALSYLNNPSDIPCPRCGPKKIEVVCYLNSSSIEAGSFTSTSPDGNYTVILYCHGCNRAAALDLSKEEV